MRSEGITGAVHEERRRFESEKMGGAQLCWFSRRMQRIRQQKQPGYKLRLISGEHAGLTAAVGVSAEKNLAWDFRPYNLHGVAETFAVAGCHGGKRRPVWTRLAKRQITAQDQETCVSKGAGERGQKPGLAIGARAMRKHKAIAIGVVRLVQEPANRWFSTEIGKFVNEAHSQLPVWGKDIEIDPHGKVYGPGMRFMSQRAKNRQERRSYWIESGETS